MFPETEQQSTVTTKMSSIIQVFVLALFVTLTKCGSSSSLHPVSVLMNDANDLESGTNETKEFKVLLTPYSAIKTELVLTNQKDVVVDGKTYSIRFGFYHVNPMTDSLLIGVVYCEAKQKGNFNIQPHGYFRTHNILKKVRDWDIYFRTVFNESKNASTGFYLLRKNVLLDVSRGWYDAERDTVSMTLHMEFEKN